MSKRSSRAVILSFLVILWLLPIVVVGTVWGDIHYWNYFLEPRVSSSSSSMTDEPTQRLKQSILHVRVPSCDGSGSHSGTSFVISPGYVATAAHVIKDHQACGKEIELIDYRGLQYRAELSGYSDETQLDLALLSFAETDLGALPLANSSSYEESALEVMTIGYPPDASTADEAAVSSKGNISSFREKVFFTSGMDLNPGNSGGPVFLTEDWTVLGVAIAKGNPNQGREGLGVVVPADSLRAFFEDRIGRSP